MAFILILLAGPVVIYGLRMMLSEHTVLSHPAKTARTIFVLLILFYGSLQLCEKYNYYLRGYRSTSFVFLLVTLAGIFYCLFDRRPILNSFSRFLLNLFVVLFLSCSGILVVELFEDYKKQLFYEDSQFRLESINRGIMTNCGLPVLFVKNGLIERESFPTGYTDHPCFTKNDLYNIRITEQDSIYTVHYYFISDRNLNDTTSNKVYYLKPN